MIDALAESVFAQIEGRLRNLFPFLYAWASGCLGLAAFATIIALFSPAFLPVWVLTAVLLSSASAGYTFSQRRKTEPGSRFWILDLACGIVLAAVAWKILAVAEQATLLSILGPGMVAGLVLCGVSGAWLGAELRLKYEDQRA